jgi:hypothetical protein
VPKAQSSNIRTSVESGSVHPYRATPLRLGLWWVDMQCVNCLAVTNARLVQQQRRELLTHLLEVTMLVNTLEPAEVAELHKHPDRLLNPSEHRMK